MFRVHNFATDISKSFHSRAKTANDELPRILRANTFAISFDLRTRVLAEVFTFEILFSYLLYDGIQRFSDASSAIPFRRGTLRRGDVSAMAVLATGQFGNQLNMNIQTETCVYFSTTSFCFFHLYLGTRKLVIV